MRVPKIIWLGLLWITLIRFEVTAQGDSLIIQNSKPVEKYRYRDIDGSPYYFSDWVLGSILRNDGRVVDDVWLNYNAYSHEMEVRIDGEVYTLDKRWHLRCDVLREKNPQLVDEFPVAHVIFQRAAHRDFADRYSTILFLGDKLTLIKDCDIGKIEKEFNDVGKTYTVMRFKDLSSYYLKRNGSLVELKLHKKKILEAFDNDPRIAEFLAVEKLDVNKESDLVHLVAYAESL